MLGVWDPDKPEGVGAGRRFEPSLDGTIVNAVMCRYKTTIDTSLFRLWGINRTEDWGNIVFNLIDAGLMSKTDNDSLDDFRDVYDMDEALVRGFRIAMNEVKD